MDAWTIVRAALGTRNYRPAKKPKAEKIVVAWAPRSPAERFSELATRLPAPTKLTQLEEIQQKFVRRVRKESTGNLDNMDYRFWVGALNLGSRFSKCRACPQVCFSDEERKAHMEKTSCTTWLIRAYRLLLTKRICAFCACKTLDEKWGVPLCEDICQHEWRFQDGANSLKAALEETKKQLVILS